MPADRINHPNSIVKYRGIANLTITELAQISRIDEWTLRQLEVGNLAMHAGHLSRLSDVFKCTSQELTQPCVSARNPTVKRARALKNLEKGRGRARHGGKLKIPQGAPQLVQEMFKLMNKEKLLVADVAAGSGISPRAISDWRYKRSPNLQSFQAVLNNFGYEIKIVAKD